MLFAEKLLDCISKRLDNIDVGSSNGEVAPK